MERRYAKIFLHIVSRVEFDVLLEAFRSNTSDADVPSRKV